MRQLEKGYRFAPGIWNIENFKREAPDESLPKFIHGGEKHETGERRGEE